MSKQKNETGAVLIVLLGVMVMILTLGAVYTNTIGEIALTSVGQDEYNKTLYLTESVSAVVSSLGRNDFIQGFQTGADNERTFSIVDQTRSSSILPSNTSVKLIRDNYESFSAVVSTSAASSLLPSQVLFPSENIGDNQGLIPDDTGRLAGRINLDVQQAVWATVQSTDSPGSFDSICGVKLENWSEVLSYGQVLSDNGSPIYGDIITNSNHPWRAIIAGTRTNVSGLAVVGSGASENNAVTTWGNPTVANTSHLSQQYEFMLFNLPEYETEADIAATYLPNQNVLFDSVVQGGGDGDGDDDDPVDVATAQSTLIAYINASNEIGSFTKFFLSLYVYINFSRTDPDNPDRFLSRMSRITSNQDILNEAADAFESMTSNGNGNGNNGNGNGNNGNGNGNNGNNGNGNGNNGNGNGNGGSNGPRTVSYTLSVGSASNDTDVEEELMELVNTGNITDATSLQLNDGVVLYVEGDMILDNIEVTITGNVTIIVGGNMTISGGQPFVVEEDGQLSLYVNGDFTIDGTALSLSNESLIVTRQVFTIENNGMIDLDQDNGTLTVHAGERILLYDQPFSNYELLEPKNVVFMCNGLNNQGSNGEPFSAEDINQNTCQVLYNTTNGGLSGIIYAPYGAVYLQGDTTGSWNLPREFRGAIIGHVVRVSGKFTVLYDESLDQ